MHFDSFINNLLVNNEKAKKEKRKFAWNVITYTALDKKGNSLWDSWFPVNKLEEKKEILSDSGMPHKFYQEYMMQVQSEEDSIFNRKHLRYHDGTYSIDDETGIPYIYIGKELPLNICWS